MRMDGFCKPDYLEAFSKLESSSVPCSLAESRDGEDVCLPDPWGSKGQQSSLAIYLPGQSHIHHETPFYKLPKGRLAGKEKSGEKARPSKLREHQSQKRKL